MVATSIISSQFAPFQNYQMQQRFRREPIQYAQSNGSNFQTFLCCISEGLVLDSARQTDEEPRQRGDRHNNGVKRSNKIRKRTHIKHIEGCGDEEDCDVVHLHDNSG